MNNFPFIDIFILAMVAVFIINRLKNTLGKKLVMKQILLKNLIRNKLNLLNQTQIKNYKIRGTNLIQQKKGFRLHKNETINEKLNKLVNQNFSSR